MEFCREGDAAPSAMSWRGRSPSPQCQCRFAPTVALGGVDFPPAFCRHAVSTKSAAIVRDIEAILLHRQHSELTFKNIENGALLGDIRSIHRDDVDGHRTEDAARIVRRHRWLALDRIERHRSRPEIIVG